MKAISKKPVDVWHIFHAGKDIYNTTWPTRYRGPLMIHASKSMTQRYYLNAIEGTFPIAPAPGDLPRGCIYGVVELVDCVTSSRSPWFTGPYGFVIVRPQLLEYPVKADGNTKIWTVPDGVAAAVRETGCRYGQPVPEAVAYRPGLLVSRQCETGVRDRNGLPIREGDILEYRANGPDPLVLRAVVRWSPGKAAFVEEGRFTTGGGFSSSNADCFTSRRIVGNIYDNPEELWPAEPLVMAAAAGPL